MHRTLRPLAAALAATVAVTVLAACGGDDKADDTYKQDAKAAVLAIRAVGDRVGESIQKAPSQTDAEVTTTWEGLKKSADAALKQVQDLQPPTDKDKTLVENLVTAFTKADKDIGAIADAASVSDPTAAKSATQQLVADAPAVKTANNALGSSVGVAPASDTTAAATTTTADTGGTTATGGSFVEDAKVVVTNVKEAGTDLNQAITTAGDQTDDVLAGTLRGIDDKVVVAIGLVKQLSPATDAQQQATDALRTALETIDGDLSTLVDAVAAHDANAAKAATKQLLADSPAVSSANDALAEQTKSS
jgi:hypothetical protein